MTFGASQRRPHGSHALDDGSVPKRAVPATWREMGTWLISECEVARFPVVFGDVAVKISLRAGLL